MQRSLILTPEFSGAVEINAFRTAYDPLAAKIPPHITLVFPFESPLSLEELTAHAREVVSSIECFRLSLGEPQMRGDFIWLPVDSGRSQIVELHELLYRGPLADYLDSSRPFEPHLTIGRALVSDPEQCLKAALALRGPFEAVANRLVIETIMTDERSNVESVIDFRNPPSLSVFGAVPGTLATAELTSY